jgi:hypothetical protein
MIFGKNKNATILEILGDFDILFFKIQPNEYYSLLSICSVLFLRSHRKYYFISYKIRKWEKRFINAGIK